MANKEITNAQMRSWGYMTADEFVDKLIPGLKEYLNNNWGRDKKALHHPEDLIMNASIYLDVACHVIADFGINNNKDK